jgi:ribosomal protein S18 acetylase RimI-like enzyme
MASEDPVTIREARTEDVPAIVALYADDELGQSRERVADPLPNEYWSAFAALEADPRHQLVVIEEAGEVVGTLQLSFIPHLVRCGTERAQIEAVRVASRRRSSGLGRRLVRWAIDQAERRGCGLVQLTTDASRTDAHRWYESFGFVASHVGMKLTLGDGPG